MKSALNADTPSVLKLFRDGKTFFKFEGDLTEADIKYWMTRPLMPFDKAVLNGKEITKWMN